MFMGSATSVITNIIYIDERVLRRVGIFRPQSQSDVTSPLGPVDDL